MISASSSSLSEKTQTVTVCEKDEFRLRARIALCVCVCVRLSQLTLAGEVQRLVLRQFDSGVIHSWFLIHLDVELLRATKRIWSATLNPLNISIFAAYTEFI